MEPHQIWGNGRKRKFETGKSGNPVLETYLSIIEKEQLIMRQVQAGQQWFRPPVVLFPLFECLLKEWIKLFPVPVSTIHLPDTIVSIHHCRQCSRLFTTKQTRVGNGNQWFSGTYPVSCVRSRWSWCRRVRSSSTGRWRTGLAGGIVARSRCSTIASCCHPCRTGVPCRRSRAWSRGQSPRLCRRSSVICVLRVKNKRSQNKIENPGHSSDVSALVRLLSFLSFLNPSIIHRKLKDGFFIKLKFQTKVTEFLNFRTESLNLLS